MSLFFWEAASSPDNIAARCHADPKKSTSLKEEKNTAECGVIDGQ
jgi:hypothetical protein